MAVVERRLGRPRSTVADEAILDAAMDLFTEAGWDGLTMEGVASRAGVAKATVYRRYRCKLDLVIAASGRISDEKGPTPDTGSLRGDLRALAAGFLRMLTHSRAGRAIPATIAATARHRELAQAHRAFIAERRQGATSMVRRAVERGDLSPDVDAEMLVDMVFAPIFYRVFISGARVDDAYLERLIGRVVTAFVTDTVPDPAR